MFATGPSGLPMQIPMSMMTGAMPMQPPPHFQGFAQPTPAQLYSLLPGQAPMGIQGSAVAQVTEVLEDSCKWPPDVEEAFDEAYKKYEHTSRCSVGGKMKGRNALISDYIMQKTGKHRNREQVKSHLQTIKKRLEKEVRTARIRRWNLHQSEAIEGGD